MGICYIKKQNILILNGYPKIDLTIKNLSLLRIFAACPVENLSILLFSHPLLLRVTFTPLRGLIMIFITKSCDLVHQRFLPCLMLFYKNEKEDKSC